MNQAQVFKALGDPARLTMINRLTTAEPLTIGELSAGLGMSRQGARKQLKVLESAQLIELQQNGRQTEVSLAMDQLQQARRFIEQLEQQWDRRLAALKDLLENDGLGVD